MKISQDEKDSQKLLLGLLEKTYEREQVLKTEVTSRINTFFAIFAFISAIIGYFATNLIVEDFTVISYALYTSFALALLSAFTALLFIGRFLLGFKYKYLPDAKALKKTI